MARFRTIGLNCYRLWRKSQMMKQQKLA